VGRTHAHTYATPHGHLPNRSVFRNDCKYACLKWLGLDGIALHTKPISDLRSVIRHRTDMGSHSAARLRQPLGSVDYYYAEFSVLSQTVTHPSTNHLIAA